MGILRSLRLAKRRLRRLLACTPACGRDGRAAQCSANLGGGGKRPPYKRMISKICHSEEQKECFYPFVRDGVLDVPRLRNWGNHV